MKHPDLSGEWHSRYTYTDGASSEHVVRFAAQPDHGWTAEGIDADGSTLTLHLQHDPENSVLTGTWRETTSPTGVYRGAEFHGAVQFVLAATLDHAEGTWVGFNSSRTAVNAGAWVLRKLV